RNISAPRAASACAVALPMPVLAPVMRIVVPSRSPTGGAYGGGCSCAWRILVRVAKSSAGAAALELEIDGRSVRISSPDRVYFPARGETKLDLARYYLAVGEGVVRALRDRPCMLHRFPTGVTGEKVHQKRLPGGAPDWAQTVRVEFPRYKRHAYALCVT